MNEKELPPVVGWRLKSFVFALPLVFRFVSSSPFKKHITVGCHSVLINGVAAEG